MNILTVNTGSSSVRLGLFEGEGKKLTRIDDVHFMTDDGPPENHLERFLDERRHTIDIAVHRIVHGGSGLTKPCLITETVEKEIERISPMAPLHNPRSLRWVRACREVTQGNTSQAAVFDTAFYSSMPDVAKMYALPNALCREHDIKRYGFHGIAHRAMVQRLQYIRPEIGNNGNVITMQLGSGCSITAVKNGTPVDTSMGFSPNEGLVMSTRSGDIDSGVITYLQTKAGLSILEIDEVLNRSSGLFGVSEISGNMKTLLATDDKKAVLAIDLYCYRVRKYIGAYAAALGGVDAVVIGGGVGENSPVIRENILQNMGWCGIVLDPDANNKTVAAEGHISSDNSRVAVLVVPVDEAAVLAQEAVNIISHV